MISSQDLIPLTGGAYQARSKIADAEVCENLFPEINPPENSPPVPVTHYPREGERLLTASPAPSPGRGVFALSNGDLYAVVGSNVYYIDPNWAWTLIGAINNLTTPVSMSDNGTTAVIVDGSLNGGWTIVMATKAFAPLVDPTGTFVGATRVDYADGFLAFNDPGTNGWYVSLINQVNFNALAIANKSGKPDPIVTLAFNIRQAWLIGTETTEIWYNAGASPFPYAAWPNILVPFGIAAAYSLAQADVNLFWLSRNAQGQAIAVQTKGYAVEAISTRALEYEWSTYQTVADCIGGTYQQAGHTFILFHFPTADKTWAYDLATKQWHRRVWTDNNGIKHRQRSTFFAAVGPNGGYVKTIIGQDFTNGQIYAIDPRYYTDNGNPIVCRRSFPHVMADMKEITHVSFVADFETGGVLGVPALNNSGVTADFSADFSADFADAAVPFIVRNLQGAPALGLRYSNDGGNTWSNFRMKGPLNTGNYRQMLRWRGLGMARDRVYELLWSYDGPSALQGAYLEPLGHSA